MGEEKCEGERTNPIFERYTHSCLFVCCLFVRFTVFALFVSLYLLCLFCCAFCLLVSQAHRRADSSKVLDAYDKLAGYFQEVRTKL